MIDSENSAEASYQGRSQVSGILWFLLLAGIIAIPIFGGAGEFRYPVVAGTLYLMVGLFLAYWMLRNQVSYCLGESLLRLFYPFRIANRVVLIRYDAISYVVHNTGQHQAGFYESEDQIEVIWEEAEHSVLLPIPKDTFWKQTGQLEQVLKIFEAKQCEVRRSG